MRPVELRDLLADNSSPTSDGCIEWTRARDKDGYGITRSYGVTYKAHRAAWILVHGPIPAGQVVRHSCDNPPCVNTQHLSLGTVLDNNRDRETRGRGADRRGEKAAMAKLTERQIPEIRALLNDRVPQASIAARYGVSRKAISKILHRQTWAHIS